MVLRMLSRLARQAKNEVAVNYQPQHGNPGELPGPFNRCTLLDVLENLWIARLISHD